MRKLQHGFATITASFIAVLFSTAVFAGPPTAGAPLPTLKIADKGEIVAAGDDEYSFRPWSSETNPATVHVIQYFGATLGDRDVFAPFTDLIQERFEPGSVHVTTILNIDAAMWGTRGMVMSELEKNKAAHPEATIVADEEGRGVDAWGLGKAGTGLIILDSQGLVTFFSPRSLDSAEMDTAIELIRASMGS